MTVLDMFMGSGSTGVAEARINHAIANRPVTLFEGA